MQTTINEALQQALSPEQPLQPREGSLETLSPSSKGSWERCDPASIEVPQSDIDKFIAEYQRKEAAKVNHRRYLAHLRKLETQSLYTAEELLYWIQHEQAVQVDEYNKHIVQGLCLYFTRDERFEGWFDEPTSLQKGILLMGNVGCGKTFLMKAFQFNPRAAYAVKPCRTVADEYKQDGIPGIRKHSSLVELSEQNPFTKSSLFGWCFDDLGTEEASNHFGDKRNVMEQVLLGCYDRSELRGRIHTTTNLTETEIVEKYGLRVRSRMNEMFNIIDFPEDAIDRRR